MRHVRVVARVFTQLPVMTGKIDNFSYVCAFLQTPTLSGLSREVVAACKQEREHYTSLLSNFAVFSLTVGHRGESHLEEGL